MVAPRGYKGCGIATSTTYSAIHACAIVELRVPSECNKRRSGPKSEDHAYFKRRGALVINMSSNGAGVYFGNR